MNMQLHGTPDFEKNGLATATIDGAEGHTGRCNTRFHLCSVPL